MGFGTAEVFQYVVSPKICLRIINRKYPVVVFLSHILAKKWQLQVEGKILFAASARQNVTCTY